jgi:hypothetical protein
MRSQPIAEANGPNLGKPGWGRLVFLVSSNSANYPESNRRHLSQAKDLQFA